MKYILLCLMLSCTCMAEELRLDRTSLENLCQIAYLQALIDYKKDLPLRDKVDAKQTVADKCILIVTKALRP